MQLAFINSCELFVPYYINSCTIEIACICAVAEILASVQQLLHVQTEFGPGGTKTKSDQLICEISGLSG